jgi:hypothetical protein
VETLLVAIVGGIVGTVLAAVIALAGRFIRSRAEVVSHDRLVHEHDQDLASWVSDRDRSLRREMVETTGAMNSRNLYSSSTHANALALVKERALHEYRDELRRVERIVAALGEGEGEMHAYWRERREQPFPGLQTPHEAEPLLDAWRSSITRHGSDQVEVIDPGKSDLNAARSRVQAQGLKEYV